MPTIVSLVKQGELEFTALDENGDAIDGAGVLPSCQVTNVKIEPNNDAASAADQEETLGGCIIPADGSDDSSPDVLSGSIVADHNVVELLTAWTWKYRNGRANFKFVPRTDPSSEVDGSSYTAAKMEFTGVITVAALTVGGDVDTRNDIDFSFDIVEYTSLPDAYTAGGGGGYLLD